MAPDPTDLKALKLALAREQRRGDMAQMEDWERELDIAARGITKLVLGGIFLLSLSFGCGLAIGYVFWSQ